MSKVEALAEVNENILRSVRDSAEGGLEWEFFCECGAKNCHERVFLTLDAYLGLHDHGGVVLAEAHRPSQAGRAQRLRNDAEALKRQAAHQIKRALRNLDPRETSDERR
jgi:hypothetical protein